MKKKLLLASAIGMLTFSGAQAQSPIEVVSGKKIEPSIELLMQKNVHTMRLSGITESDAEQAKLPMFVQCADAEAVAAQIQSAGYDASVITPELLTVAIPISYVNELAANENVYRIEPSKKLVPLMTDVRRLSGVDDIHSSKELETPFTGKGVIIGVIDQGFEFDHIAFLDKDKKSRVRYVWNRKDYPNSTTKPTTTIPKNGDGMDAGGHATHVTGIAAGSIIDENDFYGIAPDAELIMIPSSLNDAEVVEDVKFIRETAEEEGKPWVVNMSFGGLLGPHDGTTTANKALESHLGAGGLIVAAMGNDGDTKMHASYTFKNNTEKKHLIIDPASIPEEIAYFEIWGDAADGKSHLTVKPFLYDEAAETIDFKTNMFWNQRGWVSGEIDPNNKKEHYNIYMNLGSVGDYLFGVEITSVEGQSFHAWTAPSGGEFIGKSKLGVISGISGNDDYCVSECGATTRGAIGVGSYNSATTWVSAQDGKTYNYNHWGNMGTFGAVSFFSNRGPMLNDDQKPTLVAPGAFVKAPVSKYSPSVDKKGSKICSIVKRGFQSFYYEVMQGTSMASPAVAGTVALWLEAYNDLTPDQALEVIKKTAKKDNHTGDEEWNAISGYGKLDAYAGLKEVLQLAKTNGIGEVLNSEAPVTLKKGGEEWKVLFNTDESYANIALYSANGQLVERQQIQSPRRGDETMLSLAGLQPGVYLVNISTTASTMTRKVVIE